MKMSDIPEPFLPAALKVKSLENHPSYVGAFIFGSVATGDTNNDSDLDIKVITNRKKYCHNVTHPIINGVKLDISFNTIEQLTKDTSDEIKSAKRVPMLAESIILFDKKGILATLKKKAQKATPKRLKKKDYYWTRFMMYHANDKAKRHLASDPASAILSMGININDILKDHYMLNGRWWVSNKKILRDLKSWDPMLEKLLRSFALSTSVNKKYYFWSKILDYIAKPVGTWQDIEDINCNCSMCRKDLSKLLS